MRILVIGATGTIGREVVNRLGQKHEVISASHEKAAIKVDISNPESIRAMYKQAGKVDAVVSAAGAAKFLPLAQLSDADFQFSLSNKLMGQVNIVRLGFDFVIDKGSFTLTSGVLAQNPMLGSGAVSLVNAGLEGFARAAALEAPRGIRVNVVSPPWVTETLKAYGMDPTPGRTAADVAELYCQSVEGAASGRVISFS